MGFLDKLKGREASGPRDTGGHAGGDHAASPGPRTRTVPFTIGVGEEADLDRNGRSSTRIW